MGRKELFEEIDEKLKPVVMLDEYCSLFKLTKMLNKMEVEKLSSPKTTLGNAKKLLIEFISSIKFLNPDILKETIVVDKELEDIEIDYISLYDSIKELLSEYSEIMNNDYINSFVLGMLNALISIYLDRNMVDTKAIKACYNQELEKKQDDMKEIYLASLIKKECNIFCEEVAIGFVHRERMSPLDASYPISRLSKLSEIDMEKEINKSFLEALSYFASITFYNKCRDDYTNSLNTFRIIYNMYENDQINNINDLIPLLVQMNFPIRLVNNIVEIDFEELSNQINIMNESMKEKALIIGGIL